MSPEAYVLVCDFLKSKAVYVCVVGVHAGLSVEKRPAEEKLERALVHLEAKQLVLLHRGRPQGLPRKHSSGWELLCGGKQFFFTLKRTVAF